MSFLKYMPIVALVLFTAHVGLLLFGITEWLSENIAQTGLFSTVLQIAASLALKFCILHRLCIVYNYLVSVCINYHQHVGFGDFLFASRLVVFLIGIVLFILFFRLCMSQRQQSVTS